MLFLFQVENTKLGILGRSHTNYNNITMCHKLKMFASSEIDKQVSSVKLGALNSIDHSKGNLKVSVLSDFRPLWMRKLSWTKTTQ